MSTTASILGLIASHGRWADEAICTSQNTLLNLFNLTFALSTSDPHYLAPIAENGVQVSTTSRGV
jgi:hypothetical protein